MTGVIIHINPQQLGITVTVWIAGCKDSYPLTKGQPIVVSLCKLHT